MSASRLRPSGDDVALAAALVALGTFEVSKSAIGPRWILGVAMLVQTVPLAWRRMSTAAVAGVSFGGVLVELSLGETVADAAGFLGFLLLAYSTGRWARGRGRIVAATFLASGAVVHELGSGYGSLTTAVLQGIGFDLPIAAGAGTVGVLVRRRAEQAQDAVDENEALVAEWASREKQIVDDERQRIARELHDVIGHALAGIALSAGAVEHSSAPIPDDVRDALAAIRQSSQTAASDVRRLLGLLRTASDGEPLPQASLAALPALVDGSRARGLEVTLRMDGTPSAVTPALQLTVYRIVQECLTNVAKHQPHASVHVELRWSDAAVSLEVVNDGDIVALPKGPGRGLAGIRERVELYDGTVSVGPLPTGGFRVSATLPL